VLVQGSGSLLPGETIFTFHVEHLQPSFPYTQGVLFRWVWIRRIAPGALDIF
jgi:hypothetical protein